MSLQQMESFVLLLLLAFCPRGHGEDCKLGDRIVYNLRKSTAGCKYDNVTRTTTSENILLEANGTTGTLTVYFPIEHKDYPYFFTLYFNDVQSREDCSNFEWKNINSKRLHSEREFSASSCEKGRSSAAAAQLIGSVVFHHVYSSCYLVEVKNRYIGVKYSKSQLLKTDYSRILPEQKKPKVGSVEKSVVKFNGTRNMTVIFVDFHLLTQARTPVHVLLVRNESFSNQKEETVLANFSLAYQGNGSVKCTKQIDLPFLKSCQVEADVATCNFTDLIPGNYSLQADPDDPNQCKKIPPYEGYVGCSFFHPFDVKGETENEEPPEIHVVGGVSVMLFVAVALFIATVVGTFFIVRAVYKHLPGSEDDKLPESDSNNDSADVVTNLPSKPDVLLLYAQDCEIFMELMVAFREVLSCIGQCKVRDCFDCDYGEVELNPHENIQHLIANKGMKIILVSSPCAEEHQQAANSKKSLRYRIPVRFNTLFPFALHEIKHNNQRTYVNTFVARFDSTDLESIMPYKRYNLPENLSSLLTDMQLFRDSNESNLTEHRSVKRLNDLHAQLMEYYQSNPSYVQEMMYSLRPEHLELTI